MWLVVTVRIAIRKVSLIYIFYAKGKYFIWLVVVVRIAIRRGKVIQVFRKW